MNNWLLLISEKIRNSSTWWIWLGPREIPMLASQPISHSRSMLVPKIFREMYSIEPFRIQGLSNGFNVNLTYSYFTGVYIVF